MKFCEVTIVNRIGLHAKPAELFVEAAKSFISKIWLEKEYRRVDAKSILGVYSLGIVEGIDVKLIADGPDEEQAIDILKELLETGFENDEVNKVFAKLP